MKRRRKKVPPAPRGGRSEQVLAIVQSDSTFVKRDSRFGPVYVGKCLMCNRKLSVTLDGRTDATVEHILARNHGGGWDMPNLALACAGCNSEKGLNHDNRKKPDMGYIQRLLDKRAKRFKVVVTMPPSPPLAGNG